MLQDPLRQDAPSASDEDLTALVETGPVSRGLGQRLVFEESQVTDRVLGFLQSDSERAFDAQRGRVFGEAYRNELSAEEANARYGVDRYLSFDGPVNAHRAEEMNRQAQLRRYREETAARANLSGLDAIGASLAGAATDPVMLPTWFIGGGSATLRALRVAPAATRTGAVARGAAVGLIDGVLGGMAAEGLNYGARRSTGEDYDLGDSLANILVGGALGTVVGGAVGAATGGGARPRPTGRTAEIVAQAAAAQGENVDTALRIAQIESGMDPRAQNRRSSAGGLFQFIDDTWRAFGGGDKYDPVLNARNGVRLLATNREGLARALGRPAQEWELYLAHQQGLGGARELLRDPSRSAVEALRAAGVRNPVRALTLNGGRAGMTAGEFAGLWREKFGATGPSLEALTPRQPPAAVRGLTDNERVGGFAEALEAAAEDAPLDLAPLLARSGLEALDEASAVPAIRGQWLETDVAVTRAGAEIPVRFAVVELEDLRTSHSDDLRPETDYPQALQPRDRGRAGSVAENFELERDLNPKLLMRDKAASAGAPIVSPDGLVESGNGRVIALRRSSRTGTEAWARYRAELAAQGIDASAFQKPVLVRMRAEPMTGQQRADMAAALNRSQTEAYSPVEQARADARRVDVDLVRLIEGDDPFSAANRPFQRAFQERVAPGDKGALTDADGQMNPAGRERVRAALVQAAYGDAELTAALFDTADETLAAVGNALAEAAPAWARMRAEAPAQVDATANLVQAVHLLRHARRSREPTDQALARLLASRGLFEGAAVSPETEAFLRMMFRDEGLTQARGAERLAWALKTYTRSAAEVADGPNLFGEVDNAETIVARIRERLGSAEGAGSRGLAYAGGSEVGWTTREAEAAVLDLRPAEPHGGGPDRGGQRPGDGGSAARPGGPAGAVDARLTGDELAPPDAPATELRLAARAFYAETLRGTEVMSQALGRPVRFTKNGLGKAISFSADTRKLRMFPALPEMVAKGRLVDSAPSRRTEASNRTIFHYLEARVAVGDEVQAARIVVREDANGDVYYDHVVEADPAGPDGGPSAPPTKDGAQAERPGEATFQRILASDPEMKALVADTEALARAAGVDVPAFDKSTEPSTVAEAIRAAAFCLTTEFDVS